MKDFLDRSLAVQSAITRVIDADVTSFEYHAGAEVRINRDACAVDTPEHCGDF